MEQEQSRTEPGVNAIDEAALAHGAQMRMEAIELAINTAERVIAPKRACLAARSELLDLEGMLADETEDMKQWSASRGVSVADAKAEPYAPPVVRFTRETIETLLPEQLLLNLVAPFERFIADASAMLLLWKSTTTTTSSQATAPAQAQHDEDQPSAHKTTATTTSQDKEAQMFGPLLIRLLDESMSPILAYLTYLATQHTNQRIITPLCQGADLDADEPYWTILARHFTQPALLARLDSLPPDIESFGSVHPARQRAGAAPVAISPLAIVAAVGWGSIIVRLLLAIHALVSHTAEHHPDRNNIEALAELAKLFFGRLDRTAADLAGSLHYD